MTIVTSFTQAEVRQFAEDWYHKLDIHAPAEEFIPLLAEEGLELVFPEATLRSFEEFKPWYEGIIRFYFNEVHVVKDVALKPISHTHAEAKVVVKWEASIWQPPAPHSNRISLDAYQTWVVTRSPNTNQLAIEKYFVDSFDYAEQSHRL